MPCLKWLFSSAFFLCLLIKNYFYKICFLPNYHVLKSNGDAAGDEVQVLGGGEHALAGLECLDGVILVGASAAWSCPQVSSAAGWVERAGSRMARTGEQ